MLPGRGVLSPYPVCLMYRVYFQFRSPPHIILAFVSGLPLLLGKFGGRVYSCLPHQPQGPLKGEGGVWGMLTFDLKDVVGLTLYILMVEMGVVSGLMMLTGMVVKLA